MTKASLPYVYYTLHRCFCLVTCFVLYSPSPCACFDQRRSQWNIDCFQRGLCHLSVVTMLHLQGPLVSYLKLKDFIEDIRTPPNFNVSKLNCLLLIRAHNCYTRKCRTLWEQADTTVCCSMSKTSCSQAVQFSTDIDDHTC